MGTVYTGVAANVGTLPVSATVPADGDNDNAATFTVGSQKLADIGEAALEQIQAVVASTWFKQTSGTAQNLWAVSPGPNPGGGATLAFSFIAAGAAAAAPPTILTSTDGLVWTSRTAVGTSALAFGAAANTAGTLAVVIANGASGNNLMTSPTGTTWTLRTSNITLASQLGGVVHSGSLWCVVGGAGGASAVATSSDGVTWTARTLGAAADQMVGVAWAPSLSLFIACGYNTGTNAAEVFTSPDGITWTSRTVPSAGANKSMSVAWSPSASLAMMVSSAGNTWTSPDGITWTAKSLPGMAATGGGGPFLVHTGRQWLVCAQAATALFVSSIDNGTTWRNRVEAGSDSFGSIAVGPLGKLCAVGSSGVIYTGLTTALV